jgi:hypothetical protein
MKCSVRPTSSNNRQEYGEKHRTVAGSLTCKYQGAGMGEGKKNCGTGAKQSGNRHQGVHMEEQCDLIMFGRIYAKLIVWIKV